MSACSRRGERTAASGVPQVSSTFNSETGSLHQLFAPSAPSTRIISMCSTPGFLSGQERAHPSLRFCKADTFPSPEWCIPVWPHLCCPCPVLFCICLSVCTTVTHCIHFFKSIFAIDSSNFYSSGFIIQDTLLDCFELTSFDL